MRIRIKVAKAVDREGVGIRVVRNKAVEEAKRIRVVARVKVVKVGKEEVDREAVRIRGIKVIRVNRGMRIGRAVA